MIRAIFWDNDGVLVDTEGLFFAATRQTLATVGIVLTKELFIELILVQGTGAWHLASEKGYSPEYIEHLRRERDDLYTKFLYEQSIVIEGAREALEFLHGRYLMGVVTSSKKEHFNVIHQWSGLLPYFDFVLTGNDYSNFKPDPEPYLLAIKRSGFRKEECLAIEDSERGLRSAKSAGIKCFIIPNELTRTGNFSQADKVLGSIKDVPQELN